MCKVILSLAMIFLCGNALSQPKVIAHRGFWKCEGSAQNSISALRNADEAGVYGSEFDVVVSADGVAVVNHDAHIEDKDIEKTLYRDLRNITISNGEKLPTLRSYLKEGAKLKGTKLILELKPHSSPEADRRAAQIVVDEVKHCKAERMVEYITFSMEAGRMLISIAPDAEVAYLNGDVAPSKLKELGFSGLDYNLSCMQANESWFKEASDLGLTVNIWTVNNPDQMRYCIDRGADYITTDEPLVLQGLLGQ